MKASLDSITTVALDIDGTTINSQRTISKRNHDAIMNVIAAGYRLVFVTGRGPAGFPEAMKDIPYEGWAGANGSVIEVGGQIIKTCNLSAATAAAVLDKGSEYEASPAVHWNGGYLNGSHFLKELIKARSEDIPERPHAIDDISGYLIEHQINPQSISFLAAEPEKIQPFMNCQNEFPDTHFILASEDCVQVISNEASKRNGLRILSETLGFNLDETLYIGDMIADAQCFDEVGIAYAMGNSADEVKLMADYVADTNDNDGVAKVLEELIEAGGRLK
jgi:Cof subfamily protein (haloacid dehalogenase superfamily)